MAIANYRQTVLTAFVAVEDQLATIRSLAEQDGQRRAASADADRTEQLTLNQFLQGQVPYTTSSSAQVTALNARQTLSQLMSSQQAAAIALIQALGGGWHAPERTGVPRRRSSARREHAAPTVTRRDGSGENQIENRL